MIALVALALAAGPALPAKDAAPLSCPPGTVKKGAPPPEAYDEYCEAKEKDRTFREGPSRTWWDDGSLKETGYWRDGKRDGHFTLHHLNGRVAREGDYAADLMEGTWTWYFEDDTVELAVEYQHGLRHGRFRENFKDGKPRTVGQYAFDQQVGRWVTYDAEGAVVGEQRFEGNFVAP